MRTFLLVLCLASCGAPDRWQVTGGRGQGGLEHGGPDRDYEVSTLEVGISGPLGFAEEPHQHAERPTYPPPQATEAPTGMAPSGLEVPWGEILLLLAGAGGAVGAQKGHREYQKRKSPKG